MVSLRFVFFVIYLTLQLYPSSAFGTDKKVASESNTESLLLMYSTQKVQLEILTEQHRSQINDVKAELVKSDVRFSELKSDFDRQNQELAVLRETSNGINKRVDDTLSLTAIIGGLFGTLITVLLGGLGLLGYVSVTRKTKQEAETAAKTWFVENTNDLVGKVAQLENQVASVKMSLSASVKDVQEYASQAKGHINTSSAQFKEMLNNLDVSLNKTSSGRSAPIDPMLVQAAVTLRDRPQNQYTFDDWDTLAHSSFVQSDYESAAFYWLKAFEVETANRIQRAKALWKRGVSQGNLDQLEQEIQTYDALIAYVGDDKTPTLREQVVKTMINKGITQGQLNQSKQAIQTYNELIAYAGNDKTPTVRELIAKAMYNKGVTQGQLNQSEQEIQTYNELIAYVGDDKAPALREQVANAHNGIGYALLCESKQLIQKGEVEVASVLLSKALEKFELAIGMYKSGVFIGNQAYALALLGKCGDSERIFAEALRAEVDGGEKLYHGTLTDFDIHPIEQDKAFREIVERQWAIYQQELKGLDE